MRIQLNCLHCRQLSQFTLLQTNSKGEELLMCNSCKEVITTIKDNGRRILDKPLYVRKRYKKKGYKGK